MARASILHQYSVAPVAFNMEGRDGRESISDSDVMSTEISNIRDENLKKFIEKYESLPELWDNTNHLYTNKRQRDLALDQLVKIYRKIKIGANRGDVKKKINTLRSNYRKEVKKVIISRNSGCSKPVYQPTSWLFYALQFLQSEQSIQATVQAQQEAQLEDSSNAGNDPEYLYEEDSDPLANQFKIAIKNEPREDSSSPLPSRSLIDEPILKTPPKRKKVIKPNAQRGSLLPLALKWLEKSKDLNEQIPSIAKVWGEKLVTLEQQQRIYAEKAINDILFEACLGNLHRNSWKIINSDPAT